MARADPQKGVLVLATQAALVLLLWCGPVFSAQGRLTEVASIKAGETKEAIDSRFKRKKPEIRFGGGAPREFECIYDANGRLQEMVYENSLPKQMPMVGVLTREHFLIFEALVVAYGAPDTYLDTDPDSRTPHGYRSSIWRFENGAFVILKAEYYDAVPTAPEPKLSLRFVFDGSFSERHYIASDPKEAAARHPAIMLDRPR